MNPVLNHLPVLVINVSSRCNCRCQMCDIWRTTDALNLDVKTLEKQLDSLAEHGLEWVVFTGGEPLMNPDVLDLCRAVRSRGLRLTLLTTGLLLERFAESVAHLTTDLIVSLDGPQEVHNDIRGVPGAFAMLAAGVNAVRNCNSGLAISARCTVQARNCEFLTATWQSAKGLALTSLSFLAVDIHSTAFNRAEPWSDEKQDEIIPGAASLRHLDRQIEDLIGSGDCGGFIAESPAKLRRISELLYSYRTGAPCAAPLCNAPWNSAVLEAGGQVRPCFFHQSYGSLAPAGDLWQIVNGPQALAFRSGLRVADNPICRRCVCSLNYKMQHDKTRNFRTGSEV